MTAPLPCTLSAARSYRDVERPGCGEDGAHFVQRRGADRFRQLGSGEVRKLGVGHRVRKGVPAPLTLPRRQARWRTEREYLMVSLSSPVRFQLAEETLDVIGPDRLDPAASERVTDVDVRDALVALGGKRAQVPPAVVAPAGDGVVEGGRRTPGTRDLVGHVLRTASCFAIIFASFFSAARRVPRNSWLR